MSKSVTYWIGAAISYSLATVAAHMMQRIESTPPSYAQGAESVLALWVLLVASYITGTVMLWYLIHVHRSGASMYARIVLTICQIVIPIIALNIVAMILSAPR